MTEYRVSTATSPLVGEIHGPGDKSLSHRAAILAALSEGVTRIDGFLQSETTSATLNCLHRLGAEVEEGSGTVVIRGRGLRSLREPNEILFCEGSGTTMRLMAGVCGGQEFLSILDGSVALKRRPMARVTEPLRKMGATVLGRERGAFPPLAIQGGRLVGTDHTLKVASAQVKSAILLAGLFADGPTSVREPGASRDHTERMLAACGVRVEQQRLQEPEHQVRIWPVTNLRLPDSIAIPGDFSSAAFLIAAGLLVSQSDLCIRSVGVNPTRTGLLDVLAAMGASIGLQNAHVESNEPVADLIVRNAQDLRGVEVKGELVPRMIDEFPILAVVATQARGETRVRDAAELRVKESDRIATMTEELRKMGARIEPSADGFAIEGPTKLRGSRVSARNDHRLAMSLAVAGLVAEGETVIEGWECVRDSYPGFEQVLQHLASQG